MSLADSMLAYGMKKIKLSQAGKMGETISKIGDIAIEAGQAVQSVAKSTKPTRDTYKKIQAGKEIIGSDVQKGSFLERVGLKSSLNDEVFKGKDNYQYTTQGLKEIGTLANTPLAKEGGYLEKFSKEEYKDTSWWKQFGEKPKSLTQEVLNKSDKTDEKINLNNKKNNKSLESQVKEKTDVENIIVELDQEDNANVLLDNTKKINLNNSVLDKQKMLVDLGYDIGKTGEKGKGVDGVLGAKTKAALEKFEAMRIDDIPNQENYGGGSGEKSGDYIAYDGEGRNLGIAFQIKDGKFTPNKKFMNTIGVDRFNELIPNKIYD